LLGKEQALGFTSDNSRFIRSSTADCYSETEGHRALFVLPDKEVNFGIV
jgi:hypothetical protein